MTDRRRLLALVLALLLVVPALPLYGGIPTSIALIYPKQKIFKSGDWVLYKVYGENHEGEISTDYQCVQIGVTLRYRGEDCFWVETGWGQAPDRLNWSAAMLSENLFLDSLADMRPNIYMRKLHTETDTKGVPRASETRTVNPKLGPPDMLEFRPTYADAGLDTLETPKGPIVCRVVEVKRVYRSSRDMADSTMQQMTETTARRWMNLERVPITGLVREEERKVFSERTWPVGKPSTDYPMRVVGVDISRVELLDLGHGAKPKISDRIIDSREPKPDVFE